MLILTRRLNEKLMINDNVAISILGIKGGQVKIGIEAPKELAIYREEIYNKIQTEKQKQPLRKTQTSVYAVKSSVMAQGSRY